MNQKHVEVVITKQSNQAKQEYQTHLTATIDCVRFLLRQGLTFCGHDESYDSCNQDKKGRVVERFLCLVHVSNIVDDSLMNALEAVFTTHGLCFSRIRGKGYDGLQLALVVVAKKQV
ncbi:uncharacterized protein LOC120200404 [Hibiscus syriacus]|uniref:uncharacterized protein LOC120200404 n=1 Tax=Hibiscus syriacus TaxID=106335 RepID=UPI00192120FB|nr:uncharacterized protein LOC120200404 [Hibiscus syriacus]